MGPTDSYWATLMSLSANGEVWLQIAFAIATVIGGVVYWIKRGEQNVAEGKKNVPNMLWPALDEMRRAVEEVQHQNDRLERKLNENSEELRSLREMLWARQGVVDAMVDGLSRVHVRLDNWRSR